MRAPALWCQGGFKLPSMLSLTLQPSGADRLKFNHHLLGWFDLGITQRLLDILILWECLERKWTRYVALRTFFFYIVLYNQELSAYLLLDDFRSCLWSKPILNPLVIPDSKNSLVVCWFQWCANWEEEVLGGNCPVGVYWLASTLGAWGGPAVWMHT